MIFGLQLKAAYIKSGRLLHAVYNRGRLTIKKYYRKDGVSSAGVVKHLWYKNFIKHLKNLKGGFPTIVISLASLTENFFLPQITKI